MKQSYKSIHLWEFSPIKTFICIEENFRKRLFKDAITSFKSQQKLLNHLNKKSNIYEIKRNYNGGNLYSWIKGSKKDRGKIKNINIPLWILIEISKITKHIHKEKIEKNVIYYTSRGNSNPIHNPKIPLKLTPELISIIFHFCGDGHLGEGRASPSYKQLNKTGLNNFLEKLKNAFGDFNFSKNEFEDGRLNIPQSIADFYMHYFNFINTNTFEARIPKKIKNLPKEFLLAGVVSFIIDEANIGEVIEIYSKNLGLLKDIKDIAIKCKYKCHKIREKYRYGIFDSYRFSISSKSYLKFYKDLLKLKKKFPLCDLSHKMKNIEILIKRINKKNKLKTKDGSTKKYILNVLKNKSTVFELSIKFNLAPSTIREHLLDLKRMGKIKKSGKSDRKIFWQVR